MIASRYNYVVTHGVSDAAFREALQGGRNFAVECAGNVIAQGGRTVADAAAPVQEVLQLANGSMVRVTLNGDDILHMITRHTWKHFAMIMGNVKLRNTMWPLGTQQADVLRMATAALKSVDVANLVKTMALGDNWTALFFVLEPEGEFTSLSTLGTLPQPWGAYYPLTDSPLFTPEPNDQAAALYSYVDQHRDTLRPGELASLDERALQGLKLPTEPLIQDLRSEAQRGRLLLDFLRQKQS